MAKRLTRNEDAPFYFEKLYAGICFLDLLTSTSSLEKIEIKPDRKHGSVRRIEDLTKYHTDDSVEIVQIKHTLNQGTKWGFADLWVSNIRPKTSSRRKEGTNIFKFLKSWRTHKDNGKNVSLIIASNKIPTNALNSLLRDIGRVNKRKLSWRKFQTKYSTELKNIEANCSEEPFSNKKELKDFIGAFRFQKLPDIESLEKRLVVKLKKQGVIDNDRVNAFINRVTKTFVSDQVEIFSTHVASLIDRLKTGLIQEIIAPPNYIERPELEKKIIKAIEIKKKNGGFVLLFAPSGSGKTVLLSRLAEKNPDFFPYFCRIRPFETTKNRAGHSNTNRLKSSWFKADIIQRCFEFGLLPMSIGVNDNEDFIDKTFNEALKKLSEKALQRPGKKIVIIVDALDQVETDKYKERSVLDAIPSVNYPGVIFLLSTWGEKYLPQSIKNLSANIKKEISTDLYFSEIETKQYLEKANISLSQDQATIIKNKTGGLAISLFYLSKKVQGGGSLDEVIGSQEQYSEVFDWYKPIWNSFNNREKECLGYLCFHFSPVPRQDLRNIVSKFNTASFNNLIEKIEHFLVANSNSLEPYHDSFRRFVVRRLSKDKDAFHQRIAKYYSQNTRLLYGRKYTIKHLEAVGLSQLSVRNTYAVLHKNQFFGEILRSNIDNQTKVEVGKSFVNYFFQTNNIDHLVKYAVTTSDIYPTVHDEDVYSKAKIATDKLLKEVEEELLLPKGDQPWLRQEWVFKRLAIGNILAKKKSKNCLTLAHRLIDDSLFRISLDRELIWGNDNRSQDRFWGNAEELATALVNIGRYKRSLTFLKKEIGFKKNKSILQGFKGNYITRIHLQHLKTNIDEALTAIRRAPKIERLLTYLQMEKEGINVPNKKDFKTLLADEKLEKYLYNDSYINQYLDLSEALFAHNVRGRKERIIRLLDKVKLEIPYHDHGYSYWGTHGNNRDTFIRWTALRSLVDRSFKLREFYSQELKNKFSKSNDNSGRDNPEFVKVLSIGQELAKSRLLLRAKKIVWQSFKKLFDNSLKLYKEKIDQINAQRESHYSADIQKNLYPYSQDLHNLIDDNIWEINSLFPNKLLNSLDRLEKIFGHDYVNNKAELLESLISLTTPKTSTLKEKIEGYLNRALELRQKEELDNLNKSDNLKKLAVLAAHKGFPEMADDIFEKNLKYSRGLWNKGDLRITNLIDSARTQKKEHFEPVLKLIDRVSDVIEGSWYWKLDFLESAAYADYSLALDYLSSFVMKSEVNQNQALERIISTYIKRNPYSKFSEIIPLLRLMDVKEENSSDYFEYITKAYLATIKWSLFNKDYTTAKSLARQYYLILKTDVEPSHRMNLLRDFSASLADPELKTILREVGVYLKKLEQEGYRAAEKSNSEFKVSYKDLNIKQLRTLAQKGQIEALQKKINEYAKTEGYFTYRLITELVPSLSDNDLQKIRKWGSENKVNVDSPELFVAILKKAVRINNKRLINKTRSEIIQYLKSSERDYGLSEIIRELDKIDFPKKKELLRKLLLLGICRLTGSGYYLPQFFTYTSESIDSYFPELKGYAFPSWKNIVNKSMRLSLSQ